MKRRPLKQRLPAASFRSGPERWWSANARVPGIVFGCFADRVSKANKENNYLNFSERKKCMSISSKRHTNVKNETRRSAKVGKSDPRGTKSKPKDTKSEPKG